jgi:hypothetical protein
LDSGRAARFSQEALLEQTQHCIIPACGPHASRTDEPREADVRVKGAVRPLDENGMINDRQQRDIVDVVADSDTFHRTGLKFQPLLALIAAHQDLCGLSFVIVPRQMKQTFGIRPPQSSGDDLTADFFDERVRAFEHEGFAVLPHLSQGCVGAGQSGQFHNIVY